MDVKLKKIIYFSLRITGLFIVNIGIFFIINFASNRLIMDKKANSVIDEGKYILNRMAEEYEKYLREKENTLVIEKEKLITLKVQAKSLEERRQIENRLNQIESERNNLNYEYIKNEKEKKEMEANLISMKENLSESTKEISNINKKYNQLTMEKNNIEQYWNDYKNDLKNVFKEKYKFDLVKTQEIEKSFNADNGKIFIINEFKEFYKIAAQKDSRVETITKEKDGIIKQKDTVIKEKQQELDKIINELNDQKNENTRMQNFIKSGKLDKDYYLKFYNDYSSIINNFNRLKGSFAKAEKLYKDKEYKKAGDEYIKVLNTFDEINTSYKKVRELTDKVNEENAGEVYSKGMALLKSNNNEKAYEVFSELIKQYPDSKYIKDSYSQLLKLSNTFSDKEKIVMSNKNASELFNNSEILLKNKKYNEAEDSYYKLISEYPYSDFTKQSIEKIKELNGLISNTNKSQYEKDLSEKFKNDYDVFKKYYTKGRLEKARFYYFSALKNAFDLYTNNSIDEFKEFEDQYIEMLIKVFEENLKQKYKIKNDQ